MRLPASPLPECRRAGLGGRHYGLRHPVSRRHRQATRSIDLPRTTPLGHKAQRDGSTRARIYLLVAHGRAGHLASRREVPPSGRHHRGRRRASAANKIAALQLAGLFLIADGAHNMRSHASPAMRERSAAPARSASPPRRCLGARLFLTSLQGLLLTPIGRNAGWPPRQTATLPAGGNAPRHRAPAARSRR